MPNYIIGVPFSSNLESGELVSDTPLVVEGEEAGTILLRPQADLTFLSSSAAIIDPILNTDLQEITIVNTPTEGEQLDATPEEAFWTSQGELIPSPRDYFAYRLLVLESGNAALNHYSLGIVSNDVIFQFTIWNGFNEQVTIESVTVTAGQGVTVTTPSVSDTISARGEIPYIVVIENAGVVTFDASVAIKLVGKSELYTVRFTGTRLAVPYVLDAEWADGVEVVKRYKTSVFTGVNQHESRVSLRANPIREVVAKLFYGSRDATLQAWASLKSSATSKFGFPFVPDASYLTGNVVSGVVPCNTQYRRFSVGKQCILASFNSDGSISNQEAFTINGITATTITLNRNPVESYGSGSIIFPLMICVPALTGNAIESITDTLGILTIKAIEEYGENIFEIENNTYSPDMSTGGEPMYPFAVNWTTNPGLSCQMAGRIVNSGIGNYFDTFADIPKEFYTVKSSLMTREESWESSGFFNYISGRGKSFWMKGSLSMFDIISYSGGSGLPFSIRISKNVLLTELQSLNGLWIKDSAGTEDFCKVLEITEETTYFNITTSDCASTNISEIRSAVLGRLSSDEIVETFVTSEVSEIEITVQELIGSYE